jgi:hypothetical protein
VKFPQKLGENVGKAFAACSPSHSRYSHPIVCAPTPFGRVRPDRVPDRLVVPDCRSPRKSISIGGAR